LSPSQPSAAGTTQPAPAVAAKKHRRDHPLQAILLMNLAVLIFTLMDAVIKGISATYPTGEIVFFRNIFAFIPLLAYSYATVGHIPMKTVRPWGHVARGLAGVSAMFCYFLSYRLLPLSDAIALGLSGPIFLTVLSVPLLGEKVGWRRWSAVIVGFLGVLVMTRPGAGVFDMAALVPLLAAIFYALAMVSIRKLSDSEPSTTIVFYFSAFAVFAGLCTIPFGYLGIDRPWVLPQDFGDWGVVLLIGLMGGCGQILITQAFKRAGVSIVAPFDYMALVYGFLLGYFIFSEVPDRYLIVGGLVVVSSGIYIIHRETTVARQQRRAQPVPPLPTNE
jgi:drug/metabolite transporter (DMT)-like permease